MLQVDVWLSERVSLIKMEFYCSSEIQDGLIHYIRSSDVAELVGVYLFDLVAAHVLEPRSDVRQRQLDFYCMVHVTHGGAWFWTEGGGRVAVSAGDAVLFLSGTVFDFAAGSDGATVDRICFCGGLVEHLKADGLLNQRVYSIGFARRLLPVVRYAKEETRDGALRARSALFHLFTELEVERSNTTAVPSRIASLMDAIRQHPETWRDSRQMAAFCHLSEAQLRRVFKKETGLSPKMFQDTVRAQKAEELLKSGFSVNVVSDLLGYSDPFHFSRRFKAIIGKTPRDCSVSS